MHTHVHALSTDALHAFNAQAIWVIVTLANLRNCTCTPCACARNAIAFVADTMGIAALHGLLGWLIGETIPLSVISLDYPAHLRPYFFNSALPYPLRLDAERTSISFAAHYLDFPVIRATHDSGYKLIMSFAPNLEEDGTRANLAERVRRLMYQAPRDSHHVPSLQTLSDQLEQARRSRQ